MPMDKKTFIAVFLAAMMVCGITLFDSTRISWAQTGTNVSGIITQDTTWAKAKSPYNFIGPIAINNGVTLTIETGVTVNLNYYYIQVNGTLIAKGSDTSKISINNGQINFTSISNGWNNQTSTGSMLENVILIGGISSSVSLKINNVNISGGYPVSLAGKSAILNSILHTTVSGSIALVSNSTVFDLEIPYEKATIQNSYITKVNAPSSTIFNNTIDGNIVGTVIGFTITNNTINGDIIGKTITSNFIHGDVNVNDGMVLNNTIVSQSVINSGQTLVAYPAIKTTGSSVVSGNDITSFYVNQQGVGIAVQNGFATISNNEISNFNTGIAVAWNGAASATIVRNLVLNNAKGLVDEQTIGQQISISENTFFNNSVAFTFYSAPINFAHNDIQNNTQNIYLVSNPNNVDAAYNWWGTTNADAINQTIHDFKNDFNLGVVNFIPFLTEPNLQAAPNPNAPTPSPSNSPTSYPTVPPNSPLPTNIVTTTPHTSSNSSPSASPSQQPSSSVPLEVIIPIVVIVIIAVAVGAFLLGRKTRRSSTG
jgi:hypothetical protein